MRNLTLLALAGLMCTVGGCSSNGAAESVATAQAATPASKTSTPQQQGAGGARSGRMGGAVAGINPNAPDATAHLGTKLGD